MLAPEQIRLVEDTARALHARGENERALAIEAVLAAARTALVPGEGLDLPEFLTIREIARSLSLHLRVVRQWIDAGDLTTEERAGEVVVSRATLQAFLERIRRQSPVTRSGASHETDAMVRQREWVLAGLASADRDRLDELHQKMEGGRRLSHRERAEMSALQHQLADASASRLEQWIRRLPAAMQ